MFMLLWKLGSAVVVLYCYKDDKYFATGVIFKGGCLLMQMNITCSLISKGAFKKLIYYSIITLVLLTLDMQWSNILKGRLGEGFLTHEITKL